MAASRGRSLDDLELLDILAEELSDSGESFVPDSDASVDSDDSTSSIDVEDHQAREQVNRPSDGWRQWKDRDANFNQFVFSENSGFKKPRGFDPKGELDYFMLFFTDKVLQDITNETNSYARLKIGKNMPLQKRSIWHNWSDVTLEEMKAFLGVIINMGMNNKPDIQDYFSEDWLDKQSFYKDVFSRDRFHQIFWNLHLPPSDDTLRQSRGSKVGNVASYLDNKFREVYWPKKELSVDESTVGFKGRVLFKCYNKLKPVKWGLRIYVLAEAATGYISAIEPYFGNTTTQALPRPDLSFTSRIVLHLVDKVVQVTSGKGYQVFTDRFYTNLTLAEELHQRKIHLTGTIMGNRKGLPKEVTKKATNKMKKSDIIALRKEDKYMTLVWRDKRVVSMLSTCHDNSIQTVRRIRKSGIEEEIQKPTVICEYNKHMGGVDMADHYISSYAFTRKSVKWWRKLFFWLLDVSIVNAYILFTMSLAPGRKTTQRKFRKKLLLQLVGNVRSKESRKRGRPSTSDEEERLNGKPHFLYGNTQGKTKDCKVCSNRKIPGGRRETVHFCNTCTKKPGLHPGVCFENYHTKKNSIVFL